MAQADQVNEYKFILESMQSSVKQSFSSQIEEMVKVIEKATAVVANKSSSKEEDRKMIEEL